MSTKNKAEQPSLLDALDGPSSVTVTMIIDWKLLEEQRVWLVNEMLSCDGWEREKQDMISGIIDTIEAIEAAKEGGAS